MRKKVRDLGGEDHLSARACVRLDAGNVRHRLRRRIKAPGRQFCSGSGPVAAACHRVGNWRRPTAFQGPDALFAAAYVGNVS